MKSFTNPKVTFVANNNSVGDGMNPETMDYYNEWRFPWLSLALPKLRDMGYDVEAVSWQNQDIDWLNKTFIIIGPIWSYHDYPENFEEWLTLLQRNGILVYNSIEFLRWNFKKTYLLDLQKSGINVPSTIVIDSCSKDTLQDVIVRVKTQWETDDIIIKGVIDAGAFGYKHIKYGTIEENEKHFNNLKLKCGVVVQPFLSEFMHTGEYSFVFFNENLSHGFLRVPASGEERVQLIYNGKSFHFKNNEIADYDALITFRPDIAAPSQKEIQSAKNQAIEIRKKLSTLLQDKNIAQPLYVRIDGIMFNDRFYVTEIEGIEPNMEFNDATKADPNNNVVDNYVKAIDHVYRQAFNHL